MTLYYSIVSRVHIREPPDKLDTYVRPPKREHEQHPLPGTGTVAAFVCVPAAGIRVIRSRGSCRHGYPVSSNVSRTAVAVTSSPRSLRPLGRSHSSRMLWCSRQTCSGSWVDANRIDPPQMRKGEDRNCSVGYLGSAICVFFFLFSGVLWDEVGGALLWMWGCENW